MSKNLLLEYSEKLACEIAALCSEHKIDSNVAYQIKNPPQAFLQIFPKHNIPKVLQICFQNLRLLEKSVWKQKVG